MKKTIYVCDICKETVGQEKLKNIADYDICIGCQYNIIARVIKNKLINLTPWCTTCKGEGKIKEDNPDPYGHIYHKWNKCENCSI